MFYQNSNYIRIQVSAIPVVFLHAFPLNSEMWDPQIRFLKKRRFFTITLDYPGFGKSSPFQNPPAIDDYAELIYRIVRESGVKQIIAVGLSMGGYVALAMYRKYPRLFKGLVLANTRAAADTAEGKQRRINAINRILETRSIADLIKLHQDNFFSQHTRQNFPQILKKVERMMQEASLHGVIHALRAMAYRPDSSDLLSSMDFPVMVVAGKEDKFIPLTEAKKMAAQLPEGELHVLENAGHLSNLEAEAEFNRLLLDYLKRLWDID